MSDSSLKNSPKSSTQRVRDFRARKREEGGNTTTMMFTSRGRASLEVIKSVHGSSKVEGVESALFNEAKRLCPTDDDVHRLVASGVLSKKIAKAWLQELALAKALAATNSSAPFA